jgi:ATP-dependent DNA ligase
MSLRERTRPGLGIIEPCLPSPAKAPPSGPGWIHEIKHAGFRIMARRGGAGVRLITRGVRMSDPARVQGLVPEPPDDPQPLWPPT